MSARFDLVPSPGAPLPCRDPLEGRLMLPAARLHLTKLILLAALLAQLACGEGGTDVVLPSLRITTATTGLELDPDGYGIAVDGGPASPIGLDATVVMDRLADGVHVVALTSLATNCSVTGENPRSVSVVAGATATVAFAVTCSASGPSAGSV